MALLTGTQPELFENYPKMIQRKALEAVLAERDRQDAKWGEQNHDPFTWLTILMEEVGEMAHDGLVLRFGESQGKGSLDTLREETVQVCAVALAMAECLMRGYWSWDHDPYTSKKS